MPGRHEGNGKHEDKQIKGTVELSFRVDDRRWSVQLPANPAEGEIREAIEANLASAPEVRTNVARTVEVKVVHYGRGMKTLTKVADAWLAVNPVVRWVGYALAGVNLGFLLRGELQSAAVSVWRFVQSWM